MKKLILIIIIFLLVILGILFFTYKNEFLTILDERKVYNVENLQKTDLNTLDEYEFFNNGILTYNNQKIILVDKSNNNLWESDFTIFSNNVFVTNDYIFRSLVNKIQVVDKNNQKFVIPEIQGEIINVSRENDKTFIITNNGSGKNVLYILNENNEVVVESKVFNDFITGVSISDKSEGYSIITLRFDGESIINNVYFNLINDVELWNITIEDELLVKTKIINNNIMLIGTKNVYYINTNGKLMWKTPIYNKIIDYEVSKENERIYILNSQSNGNELITYDLEGKVVKINVVSDNVQSIKVLKDMVFVYNENSIYLVHGAKVDKIYSDIEGGFSDFMVSGSTIYILSKGKLVTGQIK